MKNTDQLTVNTLRLLSADMIQKANSGHPGLPLGAAPAAYTLYGKVMKHNPKNPDWKDRDRFILSAGHGSALLYSLLHVFGYGLTADDLKAFRQWNSLTPGHPEYRHTKGVEITTGPLGQGIANGTGMALAERYLAAKFNKDSFPVVDHYTYVLCGDGCMMEGVASEAASLAGTLALSKLILLYDSNNITIEGDTEVAFRENVSKRFEAYNWHVQLVQDGNDLAAIEAAIQNAKNDNRPSLIEIKTKIGFGAPNKQGKSSAHGEPLGADELAETKRYFGFNPEESFHVPDDVKLFIAEKQKEFDKLESDWNGMMSRYKDAYPAEYAEWETFNSETLSTDLLNNEDYWTYEGNLATRVSSEKVLNKLVKLVPNIIGGSADLAPSTKTVMAGRGDFSAEDYSGANLHFGVREHAMTAMANGIAAHGGLRPYVAGFFVFSDYMKPSMRLSALMKLPVVHIMTHDSIGVGEDGPTHEPVEQLAMLRSIPNFTVIRPCDTHETAAAWYLALTRTESPTAIVLSRQNLKLFSETGKSALKGGYILRDTEKTPDAIIIATGSEVEPSVAAAELLATKDIAVRVVSMPSVEIFEEQDAAYKESVLPKSVKRRLVVEAAASFGWHKYAGDSGAVLSVDTFGASAPAAKLFKSFGFTPENIANEVQKLM